MTTIKHAGRNGLAVVAFVAGSAAAMFAARMIADGCMYLGSIAF